MVTDGPLSLHPLLCALGGVCLLLEVLSQLMGSACVIVTFKMFKGDFIFLFSYLIPVSTQHLTVMKKASHVLSCICFKAQTLVLIFFKSFRT